MEESQNLLMETLAGEVDLGSEEKDSSPLLEQLELLLCNSNSSIRSPPLSISTNGNVQDAEFEKLLTAIQLIDEKIEGLENNQTQESAAPALDLSEITREIELVKETVGRGEGACSQQSGGIENPGRHVFRESKRRCRRNGSGLRQDWLELKELIQQKFDQGLQTPHGSSAPSDVAEPEVAPTEDEETASHWHKQKRAMLAKYGIDPDYRPLDEASHEPAKPKQASTTATENTVSASENWGSCTTRYKASLQSTTKPLKPEKGTQQKTARR